MVLCKKISLAAAASESNRFYPVFLPHNHFYGAPGAGAAADLQDGRRVAVYLCGRDAEPCHEHLLFCEISKFCPPWVDLKAPVAV